MANEDFITFPLAYSGIQGRTVEKNKNTIYIIMKSTTPIELVIYEFLLPYYILKYLHTTMTKVYN